MRQKLQQRLSESLTVSTVPTIYGCCGLFDLCSDNDLMSLSLEGTSKFLDWIGWEKTNVCLIKKNFITWVRPEPTIFGTRSSGVLENPCGDSAGADWGGCDFTLEDFALLRRHSPVRNATRTGVKLCEAQPRYRLDGSPITNDIEYDMRVVTEAMLQDLKLELVSGDASTPSEFDGLEALVKTGYTGSDGKHCKTMDSIIINWNHNTLEGGNGITWNGAPVAATYNFVSVLLAAFRRILDRIRWAPALASQTMMEGDVIFVAPTHLLRCLLDAYTCWSVCAPDEHGYYFFSVAMLNTYEARNFRNTLNGGMFGAGKITLDGFTIHLCPYEWGLLKGPTSADAYLLTGSIGNVKTISGQYNDLSVVPGNHPEAQYSYTDGGKFLTWLERDKTCLYREVEFQPRLLMWAPWAQVRFQNVKCIQPGGVISPDPWETSFFPESSFNAPECSTSFAPAPRFR